MAKKITVKNKEISDSKILEIAKGVESPSEIIVEKFWDKTPTTEKDFISYRREARRAIYKIIKYMKLGKSYMNDPKYKEMYELINPKLNNNYGLRWDNFSSVWDIHPRDITKIVLKEHWLKEGGGFDLEVGSHFPTAFTEQK